MMAQESNSIIELDYPAAARVIALWLKPFCNENQSYPNMIAGAAREAAIRITQLEDALRMVIEADIRCDLPTSIFTQNEREIIKSLLPKE